MIRASDSEQRTNTITGYRVILNVRGQTDEKVYDYYVAQKKAADTAFNKFKSSVITQRVRLYALTDDEDILIDDFNHADSKISVFNDANSPN